jgi:hypothetical protein
VIIQEADEFSHRNSFNAHYVEAFMSYETAQKELFCNDVCDTSYRLRKMRRFDQFMMGLVCGVCGFWTSNKTSKTEYKH